MDGAYDRGPGRNPSAPGRPSLRISVGRPHFELLLLLAVVCFPQLGRAQDAGAGAQGDGRPPAFRIQQNYPNPFNPATRIPFELGAELFEDGQPVLVTIRIYNILHQLVAVPTALDHPHGGGTAVDRLEYTAPGRHEAFWDGRDLSGREVASGLYLLRLEVNGEAQLLKMVVAK